jgi:hypothetical protein
MESRFEFRIFGSHTMFNHHLSQKFKFIENKIFNNLIYILSRAKPFSVQLRRNPNYLFIYYYL